MTVGALGPGRAPEAPKAPAAGEEKVRHEFEVMLIRQLLKDLQLPGMDGQAAMFSDLLEDALARQIVDLRGLTGPVGPAPAKAPPTPGAAGAAHVTSGFGWRSDPFHGERKFHYGLDLGAPAGTPIAAVRPGKVIHAGPAGTYGNLVIVDHGDGLTSRYAHCSSLDVAVGDEVAAGQAIARVGSTGRSTGPHLHFEVRKGGKAIDPTPWMGGSQGSAAPIRLESTTTLPTGHP